MKERLGEVSAQEKRKVLVKPLESSESISQSFFNLKKTKEKQSFKNTDSVTSAFQENRPYSKQKNQSFLSAIENEQKQYHE